MSSFWGKLRKSRSPTKHPDDKGQTKVHRPTLEPSPDELLDRLPPVYFDLYTDDKRKQHPSMDDPLGAELKLLRIDFTAKDLDALAEERAMAFEAVSERLTQHISAQSQQLQEGAVGVAHIQEDLLSTCLKIKQTRSILALTSASVGKALKITDQNKKKDEMGALLSVFQSLREVLDLQSAAKCALEERQYSDALWLSMKSMCILEEEKEMKELNITAKLVERAEELYRVIVDSLHSALSTLCSNFDPDTCLRVVQGYAFLNDQELLKTVVKDVFIKVAEIMPISIVRGNVLSYNSDYGDSDEASKALTLKELTNMLPGDQFLQAYSQVLLVFWNNFACYKKLYRQLKEWHTLTLAGNTTVDNDDDTETRRQLKEDIRGGIQLHIWQQALELLLNSMEYFPKSLWNSEMSQTIVTVLSAPSATEKHHFLTVLKWTRQIMAAGEAFSNSQSSSNHVLDTIMHRQVTRYLLNIQSGNIEAMIQLLERESWDTLPVDLQSSGCLAIHGTNGGPSTTTCSPPPSSPKTARRQSFDDMMKLGNPWELTQSPPSSPPATSSSSFGNEEKVPATSIPLSTSSPIITTTSLKMLQWITDYLKSLSSMPPSALLTLKNNITELIELFMMYVYIQFGGKPLEEALNTITTTITKDASLPGCLHAVLKDAAGHSLAKYAGLLCNGDSGGKSVLGSALLKCNKAMAAASSSSSPMAAASIGDVSMLSGSSSIINTNNNNEGSSMLQNRASQSSTTTGSTSMSTVSKSTALVSALSNQGNLFGLQARCAATGSLLHAVRVLKENHPWLFTSQLAGETDVEENNDDINDNDDNTNNNNNNILAIIPNAAEELQHHVLFEAIQLLLPLQWMTESIAASNYNVQEVPVESEPSWFPRLVSEVRLYSDKLQAIAPLLGNTTGKTGNGNGGGGTNPSCMYSIKWLTVKHVGKSILNGLARVTICTVEGRNSMMMMLESVSKTLSSILSSSSSISINSSGGSVSSQAPKITFSKETVNLQLRFVDGYIKGFFLPLSEIPEWARQHREEYTFEQIMALTSCMAGSRGAGPKDKQLQALLAQIEGSLRAVYNG